MRIPLIYQNEIVNDYYHVSSSLFNSQHSTNSHQMIDKILSNDSPHFPLSKNNKILSNNNNNNNPCTNFYLFFHSFYKFTTV